MWRRLFLMLPIICVSSIRVPVDNKHNASAEALAPEGTQNTPVFYITDDTNVDSYLIPPNPQNLDNSSPKVIVGLPSTFLLPPPKEKQTDYYVTKEPISQSEWLPILEAQPQLQNKRNAQFQQNLPLESIPIYFNSNPSNEGQISLPIPIPSTRLEPPSVDAVNEFFLEVPEEEETHVDEKNEPSDSQDYLPVQNDNTNDSPASHGQNSEEPTLALHLTPPKPEPINAPTKFYPKKYSNVFKPVPIPLSQIVEESQEQVSKANPAKYFKPVSGGEVITTPTDEKTLYHYQKVEHQRKLKAQEAEAVKQHQFDDGAAEETYGRPTSAEQETSETNFRYPGQNAYSAPLRQTPPLPAPLRQTPPLPAPPNAAAAAAGPDGRTEFRMHGMKGPHSYQFGYDTGKGKNRQFRYEERDNEGLVKGHYGYVDRAGKLRVVNYSAHPEYGFQAEEPVERQP